MQIFHSLNRTEDGISLPKHVCNKKIKKNFIENKTIGMNMPRFIAHHVLLRFAVITKVHCYI